MPHQHRGTLTQEKTTKGKGLSYPQIQTWRSGSRGIREGLAWCFQSLPWEPVGPEPPWMLVQDQQASPGP